MNRNEPVGELIGEPDPNFARLPADYGEDDSDAAVEIYTYEYPSRPSQGTAKRLALMTRYGSARDRMQGENPILGARLPEPDEVEALRQKLLDLGVEEIDGVFVFGGSKAWAQYKQGNGKGKRMMNGMEMDETGDVPSNKANRAALSAQIAATLRADLGGANPRDPASWVAVAHKRGCRVVAYARQDGPSGYYTPSPVEGECLVEYNTANSDETQARALTRALSQHVLHFLYPLTAFEPINLDDGKSDPSWRLGKE